MYTLEKHNHNHKIINNTKMKNKINMLFDVDVNKIILDWNILSYFKCINESNTFSIPDISQLKQLRLVTSNENKLKEFSRFWLKWISMTKWVDLDEVASWKYDVVTYKSLANGVWTIVEDTSLDVEWCAFWTNIKRLIENLNEMSWKKAQWSVVLWYNDWEKIWIFEWVVNWTIWKKKSDDWFWFDKYFYPGWLKWVNKWKNLSELENDWLKDTISARRLAVDKFLSSSPDLYIKLNDIKEWWGLRQK
jgi:inosine/xanthosine triphosphate pyrophosphatase family protein